MSNEHDASEQYHSQRSPDDDNEHESEVENNGPKHNTRRVAECDGNELGASHGEMMANDEVDYDHDLGPKSSSPGLPRVNGAELNYFYNSRIRSLDATGINQNFLARHTTDQSLQHVSQTGYFNLPKKLTPRAEWPTWSLTLLKLDIDGVTRVDCTLPSSVVKLGGKVAGSFGINLRGR